ncbi:MAG: right-handed parallel beta-helix repeat-containing protein [Candidatus Bathyarchaeota archaeon]|nr:right-handed parallel beta-helix repeat-containing protein [Candidatus Bathyarchaeota archaeon]
MSRSIVSGIMLTILSIGMLTLAFNVPQGFAFVRKIIVPDDCPTIQGAINAANPRDMVYVRAGTYHENVVVSKNIALFGENRNTTVIVGVACSPVWEPVILVWADDAKIANLTVTNGGDGIRLFRGKRNTVTDCVAYGNYFGLTISGSSQNFLRRNILFNNSHNLLIFGTWSISDFLQDIDSSNLVDGKPVYYLVNEENLFINPATFPNVGYLAVVNSINVQIANLSLSRNGNGLLIAFSSNTLIENVEATHNSYGISLMCSPGTMVKHCNFSYNFCGIFFYYSDHVNIKENSISHNEEGIFSMCSNYGAVYHNDFIENYRYYQARVHESDNVHWDDGYPSGGNYWSDYNGVDVKSGPYQNETGSDGIGDTPYVIDENNQDDYPLMKAWKWPILGDINYDFKVDIRDIAIAALAFGSYPDHPRWNPIADINQDDKVDIRDLLIIAMHFGEVYT